LLFPGIRKSIDSAAENFLTEVRGELEPDSGIVLIYFSEEDISRIGPWPVKRNYYALLINQLTRLKVKRIGLEVFLSSRLITQTVYDQLLKNEIEKSGKVVLSSLAGRIIESRDKFFTDSLSYPSPKLLNEAFPSGHINFIKEEDYIIPVKLMNNGNFEKAFAFQLADTDAEEKSIAVNFICSWEKFKKYSVIDFNNLVYSNSNELQNLKDKTVIIGVGDLSIARHIRSTFNDAMPGMALHAFALDNLLNNRFLKTEAYLPSGILLTIILIGFILVVNKVKGKIYVKYLILLLAIVLVCFALASFFFLKLAFSFFFLPFAVLAATDFAIYFFEGREKLLNETEILKVLLDKKEKELSRLQTELDASGAGSSELISKIKSLKSEIEKLRESDEDRSAAGLEAVADTKNLFGIVYRSKIMNETAELIKKAAPTDATILIIGESGTGKELAARAIHLLSKRKDNNFVAVNCGALSENLLESELFGHVRGAFTSANADKKGRFEAADNGTIFLDEIGETTENFQLKMLRVLQFGEIEKVGSSAANKVDVRVVAATNKDLETLVKEKKFRQDLYYRLNVFKIMLPSLRERKEDIEILAVHFLKSESQEMNFSKSALQALNDYEWKGNVRELESVIKRAVIFAKAENRNLVQLSDLPGDVVKQVKFNFEDHVLEALRNKKFSHSSVTETAKELGDVNRTLISENFRGTVFKVLCETEFNIAKTVSIISCTDDEEVNERVRGKIQTFLSNIEKDIRSTGSSNFNTVKTILSQKYKNLPVKFHWYLDEVIRWKTEQSSV